jgi:hypothetical protein
VQTTINISSGRTTVVGLSGRWVGYYPASLSGNQSVFHIGHHADHIAFGEKCLIWMMSPAEPPPIWAAGISLKPAGRGGLYAQSDGPNPPGWRPIQLRWFCQVPSPILICTHRGQFQQRSNWGSYVFVGGPGALNNHRFCRGNEKPPPSALCARPSRMWVVVTPQPPLLRMRAELARTFRKW